MKKGGWIVFTVVLLVFFMIPFASSDWMGNYRELLGYDKPLTDNEPSPLAGFIPGNPIDQSDPAKPPIILNANMIFCIFGIQQRF